MGNEVNNIERPNAETPSIRRIEINSDCELVVHLSGDGEPIVAATLAKCFPWTLPESYISVRTAEGREIALLRSLDELDPGSRDVVDAELRDKNFNPKILRILRYDHEFGISSISAETDRGGAVFQFRGREDVQFLSPTRILFRDVDGNTYEVPDTAALDPASKRHLNRHF